MKKKSLIKFSFGFIALILLYAGYVFYDIKSNQQIRKNICLESLALKLKKGITPDSILHRDFEITQNLVERSLVARSEMLRIATNLRENKNRPISSKDLMILKKGTEDYLALRDDLLTIANKYECGIDIDDATLAHYNIDKKMQLKALMLSLSAALTLYDNYFLGIVLFEADDRLRKVINDPDMGFNLVSNKLQEMTLNANSIETRHRIRRAMTYLETSELTTAFAREDDEFAYLKLLIDSSPAYNYVKEIRIREIGANKLIAFDAITRDQISETSKGGFNIISSMFGNTVGLFEFRKGKMYGNIEAKNKIMGQLQPLDILLEKTPFRLTDKLIPGHFGHVAIWTGSKAELIEMGIWENPYVKNYADEISSNLNPNSKNEQQVIEALRSGVQLNSLEDFMNIDDFAILRPIFDGENKEVHKKEALIMAFRQLGKKYDFNFDVNTTDKIVCSELAYVSFPTVDWPTEKTLGRHSISPDNVAKMSWNNVPLELIMFYHDGELIDKEIQVEKMKELMED